MLTRTTVSVNHLVKMSHAKIAVPSMFGNYFAQLATNSIVRCLVYFIVVPAIFFDDGSTGIGVIVVYACCYPGWELLLIR